MTGTQHEDRRCSGNPGPVVSSGSIFRSTPSLGGGQWGGENRWRDCVKTPFPKEMMEKIDRNFLIMVFFFCNSLLTVKF